MTQIELQRRYPDSRPEDITDAYMRGVEAGRAIAGKEVERLRGLMRRFTAAVDAVEHECLDPSAKETAKVAKPNNGKFARNMRRAARERGMTQREMCRNAGITWSSWKNWVFQGRLPQTRTLLELCDALNCTPNDLLEGLW